MTTSLALRGLYASELAGQFARCLNSGEKNFHGNFDIPIAADIVKRVLSTFVQDKDVGSARDLPCSGRTVEQCLRDECSKYISQNTSPHLENSIIASANLAVIAYAHCAINVQIYITKYTLAVTLLDNGGVGRDALEAYITHGVTGGDSILDLLAECLLETQDHYTSYATGVIRACSITYATSLILDELMDGRPIARGTVRFADHQRIASGIAEAFVLFIFDKYHFPDINTYIQVIPEVMVYVNHVNDVLSFHKEELDEERATYVHRRAAATCKSAEKVMYEIGGEIKACVTAIEGILSTEKEMEAWKTFKVGYIYAHIRSSRYRLSELGIFV